LSAFVAPRVQASTEALRLLRVELGKRTGHPPRQRPPKLRARPPQVGVRRELFRHLHQRRVVGHRALEQRLAALVQLPGAFQLGEGLLDRLHLHQPILREGEVALLHKRRDGRLGVGDGALQRGDVSLQLVHERLLPLLAPLVALRELLRHRHGLQDGGPVRVHDLIR
jgi:hypothetical protein